MDREAWLEVNLASMRATFACFTRSGGGRILELEGVFAAIHPAVRERSVFNSVLYRDADGLAAAHGELAGAYAEAGCAWTVWVPDRDEAAAQMLEASGHALDAAPRAMGMRLDGLAEPELDRIDWTGDGDVELACAINDRAYDYRPGTWATAMGPHPDGLHVYIANLDGEPAATVAARDNDGDCSIWNVATTPAARGRGLATALMLNALRDAAARGCATSTLQGTRLGRPIYERCGYEDVGALQMWEFRPPELAGQAHPGAPA